MDIFKRGLSYAPWTAEEVAHLNDWQTCGFVHPFTHGDGADKCVLWATWEGWVRHVGGPVVQTWCHAFMADGRLLARRRAGG